MTQDVVDRPDASKVIEYFVNGEEVSHTFDKHPESTWFTLTVRDILTEAGFTPADDYVLTRDENSHRYDSLDDEVRIARGERFTATFKGPTPVSDQ